MIRKHLHQLQKRLEEPRRFIQVIVGPRQVGKTTMVHQLIDRLEEVHHFASADEAAGAQSAWIRQQWEVARLMARQTSGKVLLFLDEIQKISDWSSTVKALWDEDSRAGRNILVVLLGSSRLLVQEGLTESLAGRFEQIYMGHWSYDEMQKAFGWDVEQFIWFGGYPGAAPLVQEERRWRAYIRDALIEASITKDILLMSRVDKPALLRSLFELGCTYSSQVLSFNKMLGQLQDAGNTTTLSHYLQLLDTAGLLGGLQKYTPNLLRRRASSPKLQVHNTALMSAQLTESFERARSNPTLWGRLVESAVGAHLIAHLPGGTYQLNYWREQNDEVDFVLSRQGQILALEVKSGTGLAKRGIQGFMQRFPQARPLLIGRSGLPLEAFFQLPPESLFSTS